mmetsp:Transcript_103534/g.270324  ORF Transcript_103534/g.270324 Transcript_103534/m.270324 type:complete len:246 (+) Transcript_103534:155-892(+)
MFRSRLQAVLLQIQRALVHQDREDRDPHRPGRRGQRRADRWGAGRVRDRCGCGDRSPRHPCHREGRGAGADNGGDDRVVADGAARAGHRLRQHRGRGGDEGPRAEVPAAVPAGVRGRGAVHEDRRGAGGQVRGALDPGRVRPSHRGCSVPAGAHDRQLPGRAERGSVAGDADRRGQAILLPGPRDAGHAGAPPGEGHPGVLAPRRAGPGDAVLQVAASLPRGGPARDLRSEGGRRGVSGGDGQRV